MQFPWYFSQLIVHTESLDARGQVTSFQIPGKRIKHKRKIMTMDAINNG